MTIDEFWSHIEASRRGADGCREIADRLSKRLESLPAEETESFAHLLDERLAESYRWDLWGAAYIMNSGCSDDGFEYFRGWLISQGRAFYEATLADPEHAGEGGADDEGIYECEAVLYVPSLVHEQVAGHRMPISRPRRAPEPSGTRWKEEDLPALFPRLWNRMVRRGDAPYKDLD